MVDFSLHFQLYTLFPEMFPGFLGHSLAGRALKNNIWSYETVSIRDFGLGKHQQVDDTPAGGGAGMVIRPDVLGAAIDQHHKQDTTLLYMSPRGVPLTQKLVKELSNKPRIGIICGRFEGIDQRVIDHYEIKEVSIGDYILSGGEVAALTLMDACIRLLPGVVGNAETLHEESFSVGENVKESGNDADFSGLLEYPLYTKPSIWKDASVPEVLLSGNHEKIRSWRLQQSLRITKERRPDLIKSKGN